jgi:hypothetical protein
VQRRGGGCSQGLASQKGSVASMARPGEAGVTERLESGERPVKIAQWTCRANA